MPKHKRSFLERLTGSINVGSKDETDLKEENQEISPNEEWIEENNEEAQLTVDVFQTEDDIIIQALVAGIKESDLDVSISQDMITISGHRENKEEISKENYYYQELYWGSFSRSILLPQEIDPDEVEASLKNGMLIVRLPKLDRKRVQKIKVKGE